MFEVNRIRQIWKKCILIMLLTFSTFWLPHSLALAGRGSLTTTCYSYISEPVEPVVFTFSVRSGPSIILPTDAPYEIRKEHKNGLLKPNFRQFMKIPCHYNIIYPGSCHT